MGRLNLILLTLTIAASAPVYGAAAAAKKHSFLPQTSTRVALAVRGGAGPLDATDTAKLSTVVSFIAGGPNSLSPEKATEFYGLDPSKPSDVLTVRRVGVTLVTNAVLGYCLFFQSKSVHEAVGLAAIPWALDALKTLLDDTPKKAGFSDVPQKLILAVQIFVAYALLGNNASIDKDLVMKVFAAWTAVNGLLLGLSPETALSIWGRSTGSEKADDSLTYLFSCEGFGLMSCAVYIGALALDKAATAACGYAFIPWVVWFIKVLFVTKEVEKFNQPKLMQYVWFVLCTVFAGTLGLPAKAVPSGGGGGE